MIAELVIAVVSILAIGGTHTLSVRRLERMFTARLRAQDDAEEGRRVALYKQQKASERTVQRSDVAVRKMIDQARHLHEDARLMHERADQHFAHPNVKRLLGD